jgi:hypothetical protein
MHPAAVVTALLAAAPPMPERVAPAWADVTFTIAMAVIVVGILGWWLLGDRRRRDPALPLTMLGAVIAGLLVEPVFDNTLLYWYPLHANLTVLRAFGRDIPLFVPIGYSWFFGGCGYIVSRLLARRPRAAVVWRAFGVLLVVDTLACSSVTWLHVSGFYGPQPFDFWGFPLWFAFADASGALSLGVALYLLRPVLRGGRRAVLLVLPTIVYGGVLGSITSAVSMALNSPWSTVVGWLAGLVTIGLAGALVLVLSWVVPAVDGSDVDQPTRRSVEATTSVS